MSKRLMQEKNNQEKKNVFFAKSKTCEGFIVKDCRSVSNRTGFECILQSRDAQNTKFEFGPHWHGETRDEMFQWKHSIEFSSVTFRCKYELQYGETRDGNDKEIHINNIISSQFWGIPELCCSAWDNILESTNDLVADWKTIYLTSTSSRWSGKYSCQLLWKLRYILDKIIKRVYVTPKIWTTVL